MFEKVILVKFGIGAVSALFGLALIAWGRLYRLSNSRFTLEATLLMAASRLALFAAIYFVVRQQPQSDILEYYRWAKPMLEGGLPYRDNVSCYAPLFSYLTALPLLIVDSPLSIIVLSILLEVASVPVWIAVGRRTIGENATRAATLLCIASAIAWFASGVSGVNQSWMTLLIGLAVLALVKSKTVWSGVWLGLSMVAVKFIPIVYAPQFVLSASPGWELSKKIRWTIGFVAIVILVYGGFAPFCDVMYPFRRMTEERASANIPFLLSAVGLNFVDPSPAVQRLLTLATGVVVGGAIVIAWFKGAGKRPADVMPWMVLVTILLLIVNRKSHATYIAMITFPLAAAMVVYYGRFGAAVLLGLFGLLALPESSIYFRNMHGKGTPESPSLDLRVLAEVGRADPKFWIYITIVVMDVIMIALYLLMAWAGWRVLMKAPAPDDAPPDENALATGAR